MVSLLIVIIALLVIGGGVYVYEQNKSQTVTQQTVTDNQAVPVSTSSRLSITSIFPSSATISVVANGNGINATITGTGFC